MALTDKLGALKVNKSACLQAGIDPVEATIETFNLNCDRLCLARKTLGFGKSAPLHSRNN
jgi:hypothetical protein